MKLKYFVFGLFLASFLWSQTAIMLSTQISGKGLTAGQFLCTGAQLGTGFFPIVSCAAPTGPSPVYHRFTDLVPIVEGDNSYLVNNPLAGSTVDPTSVQVTGNGLVLTSQTTNALFLIDYTLDPANPLHIIPNPNAAMAAYWAASPTVRVSVTVSK